MPLSEARLRQSSERETGKLLNFYEDNKVELYNIREDISEKKNLAEVYPDKTKELKDELEQWQKDTKAPIVQQPNPEYIGPTGIQQSQSGQQIAIKKNGRQLLVKNADNLERISLFSANGRLLTSTTSANIDLSSYPIDNYIIVVDTATGRKVEKIVLE